MWRSLFNNFGWRLFSSEMPNAARLPRYCKINTSLNKLTIAKGGGVLSNPPKQSNGILYLWVFGRSIPWEAAAMLIRELIVWATFVRKNNIRFQCTAHKIESERIKSIPYYSGVSFCGRTIIFSAAKFYISPSIICISCNTRSVSVNQTEWIYVLFLFFLLFDSLWKSHFQCRQNQIDL